MPKKNKVAKKRLDKFYYLAKDRGYRSRAAFKLLQLDKKYEFLAKAKGVLDLCAAPGSWMQVARQYMPKDSVCIGVDLAPIKAVPKCSALQEDITTQKCRAALTRELKGSVVDVVIHDGAPNVGTAWLQDAFGQNELTLHALRLATDFLEPGGWFVTKVFRSNDYNALIWVFNQLFHKVEATKPQSSRNESAEIFVVCRGFKNATIDPKFLDPKHVFSMVEEEQATTNVLQHKKGKKPKAEGYDDSRALLAREVSVKEFVLGSAPVKHLGEVHTLRWDGGEECAFWREQPQTKPEVLHCCEDLRVLGKREFRVLLAWRLKMAAAWAKHQTDLAMAEGGEEEGEEEDGEEDEEAREQARYDEQLEDLEASRRSRLKGAKRKAAEKRQKFKERLSNKMEHPGDRLDVSEETELFSLGRIRGADQLEQVVNVSGDVTLDEAEANEVFQGVMEVPAARPDAVAGSDDSDEKEDYVSKLDEQLEEMYADYKQRTQRRVMAALKEDEVEGPRSNAQRRKARKAAEAEEADPEELARQVAAKQLRREVDEAEAGGAASSDDENEDGETWSNPLLVNLAPRSMTEVRDECRGHANRWFSSELFDAMGDDDDEDIKQMADEGRAKRKKQQGKQSPANGDANEADPAADAVPGAEAAVGAAHPEAEAEAGAPKKKKAKAKLAAAEGKAGVAGSASASGAEGGPGARWKRPRGRELRETGRAAEGIVPDDGIFVDDDEVVGSKKVGGRFGADEEDEAGGLGARTHEETAQAAIERQAEAMVLGQLLVRGEKKRKLVDGAYNRHTFNDRDLPEWFVDDERKFSGAAGYAVDLPEDMMQAAREKLRAINASSIKKVAEAKARKARRQQRALTKVKKKATQIAAKSDMSEREKSKEVEKLYAKKLVQKREKKKLVVGRRHNTGSGKTGRGVKMVDPRTRADTRGEKNAAKKKSGKGGSKVGGAKGETRKGSRQSKGTQYNRKGRK